MVLRFFMLATVFLLSCSTVKRDNCYDEIGINYGGGGACMDEPTHPIDTLGRQ